VPVHLLIIAPSYEAVPLQRAAAEAGYRVTVASAHEAAGVLAESSVQIALLSLAGGSDPAPTLALLSGQAMTAPALIVALTEAPRRVPAGIHVIRPDTPDAVLSRLRELWIRHLGHKRIPTRPPTAGVDDALDGQLRALAQTLSGRTRRTGAPAQTASQPPDTARLTEAPALAPSDEPARPKGPLPVAPPLALPTWRATTQVMPQPTGGALSVQESTAGGHASQVQRAVHAAEQRLFPDAKPARPTHPDVDDALREIDLEAIDAQASPPVELDVSFDDAVAASNGTATAVPAEKTPPLPFLSASEAVRVTVEDRRPAAPAAAPELVTDAHALALATTEPQAAPPVAATEPPNTVIELVAEAPEQAPATVELVAEPPDAAVAAPAIAAPETTSAATPLASSPSPEPSSFAPEPAGEERSEEPDPWLDEPSRPFILPGHSRPLPNITLYWDAPDDSSPRRSPLAPIEPALAEPLEPIAPPSILSELPPAREDPSQPHEATLRMTPVRAVEQRAKAGAAPTPTPDPEQTTPYPLPAFGRIADEDLPQLLHRLHKSRVTARLDVHAGDVVKSIFLADGVPQYATSNLEQDRMGERLLLEGRISHYHYEQSRRIALETGRRLGAVLVDLGAIDPHDLFPTVRRHIEDIIYSLFAWEDGDFVLYSGEAPPEEQRVRIVTHPDALIVEGIGRAYSEERLQKRLGPPEGVLVPRVPDLLAATCDARLDEFEREALALADGRHSLEALAASGALELERVYQLAFALVVLELAQVEDRAGQAADAQAVATAASGGAPRERIVERAARVREGDYFALLGLGADADGAAVERAWRDGCREFAHAAVGPELAQELGADLEHIQRALDEAYHVLRDPARRAAYRAALKSPAA
jgi:hypothetical protein